MVNPAIRARWGRKAREFRLAVKALASTKHPIAAHVIPIRRCILACKYCNEYDDTSPPVPTAEMLRRIDCLAALGLGVDVRVVAKAGLRIASAVTLSLVVLGLISFALIRLAGIS